MRVTPFSTVNCNVCAIRAKKWKKLKLLNNSFPILWNFAFLIMILGCGGCSDTTPPTLSLITAVDYTHADLTFSEEVEESSATTVANYTVTPDKVAGQGISEVVMQSTSVYRLTFLKPLLPLSYTVSVTGVKDKTGNIIADGSSAQFVGNGKVVFTTVAKGTGKLSSWADSGGSDGLLGADTVCQAEAEKAGFVGTFKAWLSDSVTDALTRIGADSGPWLRTDGFPFTTSMTSLVSENNVLVPLSYNTNGQYISSLVDYYAWTYTRSSGLKSGGGMNCLEWLSDSNAHYGGCGLIHGSAVIWTEGISIPLSCDYMFHLYCFQTGAGPAVPTYQTPGKVVFVTSTSGNGKFSSWAESLSMDGLTGADNICKARATAGGLSNAQKFKGWISSGATNAVDHLSSNGPWVLPNGVKIADNKNELVDGTLFTGISLDEAGTVRASSVLAQLAVWTGTNYDGMGTADKCINWSSTSGEGAPGMIGFSSSMWTLLGLSTNCNSSAHLYCFEDE